MKRILSVILICILTAELLNGCTKNTAADPAEGSTANADPTEEVIANFLELAKIPRESGNEQAVSDYLYAWAKERGYNPLQDDYNNVIFDVPATPGCENYPRTALQCHMDMVITVEEGYDFDPEKDPIKVVRDETCLRAEHTTLGADDGIGIATAQYLVENAPVHGPLRIIITTDEEVNASGANNLDPALIADVKYLINLDCEEKEMIYISSASAVIMRTNRSVTEVQAEGSAYEIALTGGAGGHSGLSIHQGRVNCIQALCDLLYEMEAEGIDFRIASAEGGNAYNAIPASAKAVIVAEPTDEEAIKKTAASFLERLRGTYASENPELAVAVTKQDIAPEVTISDEDTAALITLGQNLTSGIYTMSRKVEGLVESSANLGLLSTEGGEIRMCSMIRSSESAPEQHLLDAQQSLAERLGFAVEIKRNLGPWPVKSDSVLIPKALEVFQNQTGREADTAAVHAGLECATFAAMNPEIDIISIGPEVKDAHTIKESVTLETIPATANWVQELLAELKE